VHGLGNLLIGGTTLAAYHIYPHMAKLFPVFNSRLYWNKFCPSGILAINFCSSCNLDKSDDQKQFAGDMKERLGLVVNQFQHIRDSTVEFVVEKFQQAANALKHMLWWGVCLPATCCYQYMLVFEAKLRCISSLCVQVLVQLTESRTTGSIYSWQDCFPTVLSWLYI
jgi:hypothetical protein